MNFYVFPLHGEHAPDFASSVAARRPQVARPGAGGRGASPHASHPLLPDSDKLLFGLGPPAPTQKAFLPYLTLQVSGEAGMRHGHKLVVRSCRRGEINCLQTMEAGASLVGIIYRGSLHVRGCAKRSTHKICTVFLKESVSPPGTFCCHLCGPGATFPGAPSPGKPALTSGLNLGDPATLSVLGGASSSSHSASASPRTHLPRMPRRLEALRDQRPFLYD